MARGMHLTIDEWFYHWLEDETKYLVAAKLFMQILDVCDKIVLQKNTRLAKKFYNLAETSGGWPPQQRNVVRIIKNQFLANSIKIHWVDEVQNMGEEMEARLPRKDVYLVKICLESTNKILVTSDNTLHQNLLDTFNDLGITPYFVQDFVDKYPEI